MKYQQEQTNITQFSLTREKSKRRDRFETAAIARNIFQGKKEGEYIHEIKQQHKVQFSPLSKNIQSKDNIEKEQIQATRIEIKLGREAQKKYVGQSQESNKQDNFIANQSPGTFIFEDSDSQEDEQANSKTGVSNNESSNNKKNNGINKIIFEDDDSSDQQQSSTQAQNSPVMENSKVATKSKIELFGQMVEVEDDAQFQEQLRISSEKNNLNLHNTPQIQDNRPKQLLKANSLMPQNTFAKMRLIRDKSYASGTLFKLFLQSNMRFILATKNVSSQTYILSENINDFEENGRNYLGKIKTTFFGNQINLFSMGYNPQKSKQLIKPLRQIICTVITHQQQIMEDVKPRDFSVYILKPGVCYYKDLIGTGKYEQQIPLNKLFNEHKANRDKIYYFENRKSKWNQKQKMHSLNMKGRAKLPSIKNFILENPVQNGRQIMLFGKMQQNQFSFDIHHPISPAIGMAIAISSFVHKTW